MPSRLPYFDGDFTKAAENGPPLSSIDPNNFGSIYTYQYCMRAANFLKANSPKAYQAGGIPLGQPDPHKTGAFLVEGSTPTALECGIVQWKNTYMTVPLTRTVPEIFAATYQFIDTGLTEVVELALSACARVTYTYYHAPPAKLETLINGLKSKFRYITLAGAILTIGEEPADDAEWILGDDENMTRVKGHIWEKRHVEIRKFTPAALEE